jgi:hypothetical protein
VRLVTLPKGTFVKFKAHDSHFFVRYPDPKPMYARYVPHTRPCALAAHHCVVSFETVLRNFAALSQGDHIDITFDATSYHFEVRVSSCSRPMLAIACQFACSRTLCVRPATQVLETQPHTAIDINNVDIEVEFQRTLTEAEQLREIARIKKEREEAENPSSEGQDKGKEKDDQGRRLDEQTEDEAAQADTVLCKNWYTTTWWYTCSMLLCSVLTG